jgi:hypothetical protein
MRLKGAVFESRVTQESDGVLTIFDVDQSPCPPMLLRPRPKSPGVLNDFLESTVSMSCLLTKVYCDIPNTLVRYRGSH